MRFLAYLVALLGEVLGSARAAHAQAEPIPAEAVYAASPPAAPPSTWSDQLPPSQDPRKERHDGFMLRLTLGFGYSSTRAAVDDDRVGDIAIRGFSGSFSFDIGGSVTDNIVLHARISDFVLINPTVSVDGEEAETELSLGGFLIAPAVTYYFMPVNLYLTLALGFSWLRLDAPDINPNSTNIGFGANLDVGKEWWVSDNWGLGLAARFWWTHATESKPVVTYNMLGLGAVFSATYN